MDQEAAEAVAIIEELEENLCEAVVAVVTARVDEASAVAAALGHQFGLYSHSTLKDLQSLLTLRELLTEGASLSDPAITAVVQELTIEYSASGGAQNTPLRGTTAEILGTHAQRLSDVLAGIAADPAAPRLPV
jgi:hypothetical protein